MRTFALASDHEVNWEMLISTFFFGIAYFLPLNIRAVLKTGTKKFDPAAAFATQTNPKPALVPGYSHFDKRHFHLRRETTLEHKLGDLPRAASLHLSNGGCMQMGRSAWTSGPHTTE